MQGTYFTCMGLFQRMYCNRGNEVVLQHNKCILSSQYPVGPGAGVGLGIGPWFDAINCVP